MLFARSSAFPRPARGFRKSARDVYHKPEARWPREMRAATPATAGAGVRAGVNSIRSQAGATGARRRLLASQPGLASERVPAWSMMAPRAKEKGKGPFFAGGKRSKEPFRVLKEAGPIRSRCSMG